MFEIFRMQIGQMLGGRMKWLVMMCLTLPVLLTLAVAGTGGFQEIRSEIEREQDHARSMQDYARGELPETAERVRWEGEDVSIGGRGFRAVTLTRDAVEFGGFEIQLDQVYVINDGHYIVIDGELWRDPAVQPRRRRGLSINSMTRMPAGTEIEIEIEDQELTMEVISGIYLFLLYPQAICLLLALFYGTSVLGSELDGKTLTYLFVRPLPRWQFVVGKFLGIVTALAVPASASLLISWLTLGAEGGARLFGALLLGTLGALAAYNALFTFFGFLIPRRAMIAALLYGLIFELILSFVPALVNQVTITYYLRSLVVEIMDLEVPREITRIVGGASIPVSLFALATIVAITIGLSSLLASRREYLVKDRV